MLNELKDLNYPGNKDGLLYFLCEVIGNDEIHVQDIKTICSRTPREQYFYAEASIKYCLALGWIQQSDNKISATPVIIDLINKQDRDVLNNVLISSTVNQLFEENILNSDMFYYDVIQSRFAFKNESLSLSFSGIRNVLYSQGFFIKLNNSRSNQFYINSQYDSLLSEHCKKSRKKMSLDILKKELENNAKAGEEAELFVMSFEKKRVGSPLCNDIRRISEIDVMAGYDIVSFDSCQSQRADRFIEVKAVSKSGFYWSKNEIEIAQLKGESYYIYLVNLNKISEANYIPEIIKNPAVAIINSDEWFVDAQSYSIKRIQ